MRPARLGPFSMISWNVEAEILSSWTWTASLWVEISAMHCRKTTASCDLMLVLIGRNWAATKDEGGRVRLENPDDYVRLEVEAGLKRNIVVTPVLVQGAHMPAPEDLPAEIRNFAHRNAFELSHNRWESDVQEMVRRLELGGPANGHPVKPSDRNQSVRWHDNVTADPAIIQTEPQHGLSVRRVRLRVDKHSEQQHLL